MIIRIALYILVGYLILCLIFYLGRNRLLYFPDTREPDLRRIRSAGLEPWPASDESFRGYLYESQIPTCRGSILVFHGNAGAAWQRDYYCGPLGSLGYRILLVEYPGYGRSDGSPGQKSISEAFKAAYDMLVSRPDIDARRIILFGRSVGGGAVCDLAAKRPSAALMLISAFTSTRPFATRYLAPGFLIRDPFDNLSVVRSYTNPILIMHGKFDTIIPYSHGKTLYKAARDGKMITYPSGHNDCPPDPVQFWRDISTFLNQSGLKKSFSGQSPK